MSEDFDVAIIGAGPAGGNAALTTAHYGLRTVLIDEQPQAGGQIWRAKSAAIVTAPTTPESIDGGALRTALANSAVSCLFGARVWQIEARKPEGWKLGIAESGRTISVRALILATGAQERVIPVPGWTLPGVIGLAGATALFKRDLMLPGRKTVVAGCGPLLFFVAAEILRLGGKVAAVASLNSRSEWISALPVMATRPSLLARGLRWMMALKAASTPVLWRHTVAAIGGGDKVENVALTPVDTDWAPVSGAPRMTVEADSLCIGHGLAPAVEAGRLAGAAHVFCSEQGGWIPEIDEEARASRPLLWECGDSAGVFGVAVAPLHGRLAGLSAAAAIGARPAEAKAQLAQLKAQLARARRFGAAMSALARPRSGLLATIQPDTIVCRCESVTRGEIETEMDGGGLSIGALKSGTRLGMGPCGGRFCHEAAAMIACARTGQSREMFDLPAGRPPLRPAPIGDLAGGFDYDNLPIPPPAPL